jgi:hypothetical protein
VPRARSLGRLERLPLRQIVLVALSAGVIGAVAYGCTRR